VADDSCLLTEGKANVWDSKKVNSSASIQVAYNGGMLIPTKKYYWKLMVWDNKDTPSAYSNTAFWQMGLLTNHDWNNAKWIAYDVLPDTSVHVPMKHGNGKKAWGKRPDLLPLFRKEVSIQKPIKSATAFVSGLGHFEMSINGEKTGDHFLDPGWTQYAKAAQYVSFDISNQLKNGNNVIGFILGNGFYYIPGERYRKMTGGYGYPKLMARLVIEYTDGSKEDIISDSSWRTAPSPIYFSSIFGGEDYNANLEQKGWNTNEFDDASWKMAKQTTGPRLLQSQMAEPVKIMEQFEPVSKNQMADSSWVFDLGQNFSGIPAIELSGRKGDTIQIFPGELILTDGSVNQKATGSPHFYTYILKGEGLEKWQPRFTYYGFRYLQVRGAVPETDNHASLPKIKKIQGLHTRNAAATVGAMQNSNELFNKTNQLILWAIKSNMVSVFTDCPHREKLGWLEQTHLMGSSVQYNYDIAALNKKLIRDMKQAQYGDGKIPEISPEFTVFAKPFDESPEWGSAAVIVPWYNYQWYGDLKSLADSYEMMKGYVRYLKNKSTNHILSHGLGDWFDIGPDRPGVAQLTPISVTATAMYYFDITLLKKTATLLGNTNDALTYHQLAQEVKQAYNDRFFKRETKQYATGSQTANAISLYFGLVEEADKNEVLNNLVKDIQQRKNALTAGDIGYRYVLQVLQDAGRSDVIFDMNNRSDVPGYGYQLAHGATALTESWQALPNVSNNHFMLGHLMEWFYAGLCGIRQAEGSAGYKQMEIKPQPVGDIKQAKASYHSVYGLISVEWKIENDQFVLDVVIPPNTTATVFFPKAYSKDPQPIGSGNWHFELSK